MPHKKFTMEDHFKSMDEIRERLRRGLPRIGEGVRGAIKRRRLPRLPRA